MRSEKAKLVKNLFEDIFKKQVNKINSNFQNLVASFYLHPPNSEQETNNFCLGIDVVFQKIDSDKSDNLCLEIYVEEMEQICKINAKIAWGYPTNEIVSQMFKNLVKVDDRNLEITTERLPDLFSRLLKEISDNPNGK